ncbi:MAG: extracellular solute-binding protein, partial [Clostridia bacterium]|nr:extracellular solute-binding protein [Clostridia bacterium]
MNWKRLAAAALAVFTVVSAVVGCGKKSGEEENAAIPRTEILTGVYRGEVRPLPEGYDTDSRAPVVYDPETDTLTCLANGYFEDENGDYRLKTCLFRLGKDGTAEETPVDLGEGTAGSAYVQTCVLTEDCACFLAESWDGESGETTIFLVRQKDGETERVDDLARFFSSAGDPGGWFYVKSLCMDGEGNLYLACDQEIAVLNPDLTLKTTIFPSDWIDSMTAAPDGTVWISGWFGDGGERGIAPIDPAASSVGKALALPRDGTFFYGPDFDLYLRTDTAICGLTRSGDSYESETLLDFVNSNISPDDAELLSVVDRDTFVMLERGGADQDYRQSLVVYRHAEDVDLSKITVIELAYGSPSLGYSLPGKVVAFNKAHPDIRIVVKDYSSTQTDDWEAGSKKLALDMTTGIYRPDIVAGDTMDRALNAVLEKKLYADLSPYMEKDDTVNRGNLFGAALSAFSDGDAVWTLGGNINLRALLTTKALLGQYGGNGAWSISDFVSFARSLPEGVILAEGLTRQSVMQIIGGGDYQESFIDRETGTCSFDSEEFAEWLSFLMTLPKTFEEYAAGSEIENTDWEERYRFYLEGKIALKNKTFWDISDFLMLETVFGTKDFEIMGYPTAGGKGTGLLLNADLLCSVTKWCADPEAAWAVLKSFVDGSTDMRYGRDGIPALKSLFNAETEEYFSYEFHFYYDGSASWGTKSEDGEFEDDRPHLLTYFTEEDAARIRDFLDRPASLAGSEG